MRALAEFPCLEDELVTIELPRLAAAGHPLADPVPVFVDATGRRHKRLRLAAFGVGTVIVCWLAVLAISAAGGSAGPRSLIPFAEGGGPFRAGGVPAATAPRPAPRAAPAAVPRSGGQASRDGSPTSAPPVARPAAVPVTPQVPGTSPSAAVAAADLPKSARKAAKLTPGKLKQALRTLSPKAKGKKRAPAGAANSGDVR